jgi:hypothetical protein
MSSFNSYVYVFPVLGLAGKGPSREIHEICGTAFPLGGGVFITAGHVLSKGLAFDACELGFPEGDGLGTNGTTDHEIFPGYDIGLFRAVKPLRAETFRWKTEELLPLSEAVRTTGFPYAWDSVNRVIGVRGFVGHTISCRKWFRLSSTPIVYELSFACPRGLSGAPLWVTRGAEMTVEGMIIGNEVTEMIVYTEKEQLVEPDKTRELIKTEALHLGLALSAQVIVSITSSILGGSIGDWLRKYGNL